MKKVIFSLFLGASLAGFVACEKEMDFEIQIDNPKTTLTVGEKIEVKITSEPAGLDLDKVNYSFSEEGIIDVEPTENGFKLTAKKKGTTTMTVSCGKFEEDIRFTVKEKKTETNTNSGSGGGSSSSDSGGSDDSGSSSDKEKEDDGEGEKTDDGGNESGDGDGKQEQGGDSDGEQPGDGEGGNEGGDGDNEGGEEENPSEGDGGNEPENPNPGEDVEPEPTISELITMKDVPASGEVSAFKISQTEITQKQWIEVGGNHIFSTNKPSNYYGKGDNLPMYYVSWYDAVVFCNKLSVKEGKEPCYHIDNNFAKVTNSSKPNDDLTITKYETKTALKDDQEIKFSIPVQSSAVECDFTKNGYRLPTEAEWELAAGGEFKFSGSNEINDVAWYDWNVEENKVQKVGEKQANALEIFDMSGNVWEWCWDSYDSSGETRAMRGGSYKYSSEHCAVDYRYSGYPFESKLDIGFRVVCK